MTDLAVSSAPSNASDGRNAAKRAAILAELQRRGITGAALEDLRRERMLGVKVQAEPLPDGLEAFIAATSYFSLHDWQKQACARLQGFREQKGQRVMMHKPPQFGGSHIVSKRFPACYLGWQPTARVVLAAYNVTHASGFGEVVRDVMRTPGYREAFPESLIPSTCSSEAFSTKARAALLDAQDSFRAVGLLSGFTGTGADLLIIDDPYASPDDARSEAVNEHVWRWWKELASVRINDDTNVVVMFHRYHEDDFAGRLLAEGGWEYWRFPARMDENEDGSDRTGREFGEVLSPIRSEAFLDKIAEDDPMTWLGMFQGRPRAAEGGFIHREWLKIEPTPPLRFLVRFWDLATSAKKTGDWTVGALGGIGPDQKLYLKDRVRFRAEWPDAYQMILSQTREDALEARRQGAEYVVGVDATMSQQGFFQQLMRAPIFNPDDDSEFTVPLWPWRAKGDKKEAASAWVARARMDGFRMALAPWNQEFVSEAIAFDGLGLTHDDQIDAVSGLYNLIWHIKGGTVNDGEPKRKAAPGSIQALIELSQPPKPTGIFRPVR